MQLNWLLILQVPIILIFGPQCSQTAPTEGMADLVSDHVKNETMEDKVDKSLVGQFWIPNNKGLRSKRAMAIKNKYGSQRWPGGIIPYQITNHFSAEQKKKIQSAMQEWMKYTCIQFKNQPASNAVRIQPSKSKLCHSVTGMMGGVQVLGLAKDCHHRDVYLHELGHAMGLIHEHQRPDRDEHIMVKMHNVKAGLKNQFKKLSRNDVEDLGIPFDPRSIMEYGSWYLSKNDRKTVVPKGVGKVLGPDRLDEWTQLKYGDIQAVNKMYPCTAKCPTSPQCSKGFIGKDCKCWCPPKLNGIVYDYCDTPGHGQKEDNNNNNNNDNNDNDNDNYYY